jgi:hypothetical protein
MKLAQAREYYELGVLTALFALKDPASAGWLLVIEGQEGRSWTLQTALGEPKVYATVDSLTKEVERIVGSVPDWTFRI